MKKHVEKEIFVLRAEINGYFIYATTPKNFRPDHTDKIEDATQFDERDKKRFPTLLAFRNAITGLKFEVVQLK